MGWFSRVEKEKTILSCPSSRFVFSCLYAIPNHWIQNTPLSSLLLLPSLNKYLNMQNRKQDKNYRVWALSLATAELWSTFERKAPVSYGNALLCPDTTIGELHVITTEQPLTIRFIVTLYVPHTLTSLSGKHFCCKYGLNGPCKEGRCIYTGHPQNSKSEVNNTLRTNYHKLLYNFYYLYYMEYRRHSSHKNWNI